MSVEKLESILPNNPDDLKKIKDSIHEISGSMFRIESEKDLIKEIYNTLAENYPDVEKKLFSKIAAAYHKSNKDEIIAQSEQFEKAYSKIFGELDNVE